MAKPGIKIKFTLNHYTITYPSTKLSTWQIVISVLIISHCVTVSQNIMTQNNKHLLFQFLCVRNLEIAYFRVVCLKVFHEVAVKMSP